MNRAGIQIAQLSPAAALAALGSGPAGLAQHEAERRAAEFGLNRVEAVAREPLWLALLKEFTHFFALLLWAAAGLAFLAEHFESGQGMAELGIAIIGVIVVNGLFSFWQAYRAERALAALSALLPHQVEALRDGHAVTLAATDLVPGDLLLLTEGSQVPADCRIVEAWGLRANMATLTGESLPKARNAESDAAPDALAAHNLLLAGTLILSGECRAVVFTTGMETEFGRIAHLTQTAGETESPLQVEIRHVSRVVAVLAVVLGVVFFAIGQAIGLPFWANAMFAIGIIVANVPEGLLPTVTLALALATQRMAKRNALVRHLPAVETLGSATVILTDKTGTLTENRMAVRELYIATRHLLAAERWPRAADAELRAVARHCHTLKFHGGEPLGDPMEVALWQFAGTGPDEERLSEIPFDADRRRMSVVTRDAQGRRNLWCKGAPENVLPLCVTWLDGGIARPFDAAVRQRFEQAQADMADRGLRVLAMAWRPLAEAAHAEETELQLCGLVGLDDPPRADVHAAVARCFDAGLRVIMITGDHPRTALAIAREVGLVQGTAPAVILGEDIRRLSGAELQLALAAPEIVFARVTAEQKMLVVRALRHKGEIVAVTGDGLNDAPALKSADFLTYILTSNIPEIVPYLAFVLFRIPLPLTIIQILAVDLGTDMLPALALGAEPPHEDVMKKPPRPRHERLLSWPLLARAYLFLGPLEAIAAMAAFFSVLDQGGWHYGEPLAANAPLYLAATTACLAAIVLAQMVNVFVCRHPTLPAWRFAPWRNPWLLLGLAVEAALLLALVYLPAAQRLFGTAPLALEVWLYMLPFALALGVAEETRKWLVSAFGRRGWSRARP
ncbi:MAG: cation-transporting P-type ATPase [Rhodocyclales bacterium]|nr:cation-transporting P-type ATPase [Rhodocyclales bacterium]